MVPLAARSIGDCVLEGNAYSECHHGGSGASSRSIGMRIVIKAREEG